MLTLPHRPSSRRKPGSSFLSGWQSWVPAFAGMTAMWGWSAEHDRHHPHLHHRRPPLRGGTAGAGALCGGHTHRQPGRHDAARARHPRRRRDRAVRGHAHLRQADGALRHQDQARALSRAQCAEGAARDSRAPAAGRHHRADLGCRHAARLRPRLPAGEGSGRDGHSRHRLPRPLRRADRACALRPSHRPLPLRGLRAAEAGRAEAAVRRVRQAEGHADLLRKPAPHRRDAA